MTTILTSVGVAPTEARWQTCSLPSAGFSADARYAMPKAHAVLTAAAASDSSDAFGVARSRRAAIRPRGTPFV
jgi:hypothetical protein